MSKFWLIVSAILMVAYVTYVIWAKLGSPPIQLSELGEFLLFSSSVLAFSLQVFVENAATDSAAEPLKEHQ